MAEMNIYIQNNWQLIVNFQMIKNYEHCLSLYLLNLSCVDVFLADLINVGQCSHDSNYSSSLISCYPLSVLVNAE